MKLYDSIKAIADEKGIPIYKIEDGCDFSRGSMCKWNQISPSWEKVSKVAKFLGVSIDRISAEGELNGMEDNT